MCKFFLFVNYNILFQSNMVNSKESAIKLAIAVKGGSLSAVRELVECFGLDCHAVFEDPENVDRATFLHMAVTYRREDVVKYLIEEQKVNVDQRLADGKTALHIATIGDLFEIAKLLVKNGADCNAVDKMGFSACHYAAPLGRAEIIDVLVKQGKADINKKRDERGTSPFHIAAGKVNHSSFLKLLIDLGADLSARDLKGHSALHYAVKSGNVSTVKFLIEESYLDPNQLDENERNLLHFVLDSEGETETVAKRKAEIVEYLVKEGKVNVNAVMAYGATPLHVACKRRDVNIVKLLVDGGADCKARDDAGDTPLHHAAILGKVDIVKYLIEQTSLDDLNKCNLSGETPVHFACMSGELDCLKLLLDSRAHINSADNSGFYCLHFAVIEDKADIVKYLVQERKFDVNRAASNAVTSLHLAASSGYLEMCKLLVLLGADYALTDVDGNSALHCAAKEDHLNILEYFIKGIGQDANKYLNKLGASPLHLTCELDHLDCVKFLVENGADYKLLDNEGRDCLDLAAKARHLNVFRFLWEIIIK